jgi:hypothetical protein
MIYFQDVELPAFGRAVKYMAVFDIKKRYSTVGNLFGSSPAGVRSVAFRPTYIPVTQLR